MSDLRTPYPTCPSAKAVEIAAQIRYDESSDSEAPSWGDLPAFEQQAYLETARMQLVAAYEIDGRDFNAALEERLGALTDEAIAAMPMWEDLRDPDAAFFAAWRAALRTLLRTKEGA